MQAIDELRRSFPPHSEDIAANLHKVLADATLTATRRWGAALACAAATRHRPLCAAVESDALAAEVPPASLDDARAAASLMAMNNVYYRFKHFMADPEIEALPSRLRMKRLARPRGDKTDFEFFCLAVSALHGCEACVRWHAQVALRAGLSKRELAAAARIAATLHAAAVALDQR